MSEPSTYRLAAMGVLCALGNDLETISAALFANEVRSLEPRDGLLIDRPALVGAVHADLPTIPAHLAHLACRNNALALAAFRRIETEVRNAVELYGAARVGVVVGTTTSGVDEAARAIAELAAGRTFPPEFHYAQMEHGGLALFLADVCGARGPAYVISTACSSSAKALVSARSMIDLGFCDAVVCGGVDTLCRMTTRGFFALEALSPERTNPMSRNRRGLNLGEAAALFLMTRQTGGLQLVGGGESSDAHHMSAPSPDGAGAEAAMRAALDDARARPEDVLYLNLHGTGTPLNDASESAAVMRVFGPDVPCSSTKPRVGHTLGAAGALEAAFCALTLLGEADGRMPLPPHDWDGEFDPALPRLKLVRGGEFAAARGRRLAASNGFGFGGNNCTIVIERSEP